MTRLRTLAPHCQLHSDVWSNLPSSLQSYQVLIASDGDLKRLSAFLAHEPNLPHLRTLVLCDMEGEENWARPKQKDEASRLAFRQGCNSVEAIARKRSFVIRYYR